MHHFIFAKAFGFPKDFFQKVLWSGLGADAHTFLSEKGVPKNFRTECTTLFWRKLLKFQETFPEKFLVSGFGAEATTFNAHTKSTALPCFFILSQYVRTAVRGPCFKGLLKKSLKNPQNFHIVVILYSGKDFKVLTPRKHTLFQIRYFLFLLRQRRGTVSTYSKKPYRTYPLPDTHNLFSRSLLCNHPNKL